MGCNCSGCPVEDIAVGVITIVEVPAGVMIGGGVKTAALPPPQPSILMLANAAITTNAPLSAIRLAYATRSNARP